MILLGILRLLGPRGGTLEERAAAYGGVSLFLTVIWAVTSRG